MANNVEATITLTDESGVSVPITFDVEWPENMGYYALQALNNFDQIKSQFWESLLQQLVANGDTSLLAHLPDEEAN